MYVHEGRGKVASIRRWNFFIEEGVRRRSKTGGCWEKWIYSCYIAERVFVPKSMGNSTQVEKCMKHDFDKKHQYLEQLEEAVPLARPAPKGIARSCRAT